MKATAIAAAGPLPSMNTVIPIIPGNDHLWGHRPEDQLSPAAWMTPGGFHAFEHRWALTEAFRFHMQGRSGHDAPHQIANAHV
jgi:hypothetical protein